MINLKNYNWEHLSILNGKTLWNFSHSSKFKIEISVTFANLPLHICKGHYLSIYSIEICRGYCLPLQIYNCHYLSINPQWWSKVNWGITFKNLYIWWQIYYLLTFLMTQQIVNSTPLRMSTNIQTHTQQEAIQSNSNQLFADSPCFTVNKYEHVHRRLAKLLRCTEKWGLQNDRYTQLKTLPLRNFVGGW